MAFAVRLENVTKQFRRGENRPPTLRTELADVPRRIARAVRGQEPIRRGPVALRDVSIDIEQGDAVAIIGRNGAGKSTLLRLVARISPPTSGVVRVRGRVGALIEVGSGVHPELTGRENIWLYGSILGIPRREIARRFDAIVDFAELDHVVDAQVKYFSSGMQLRLGFAIASHLEPDVFVVDEALAVGDAAFQAKCVEHMTSLVAEGKTLIFVSHSLAMVQESCRTGVLLDEGRVIDSGPVARVVKTYVDRLTDAPVPSSAQAVAVTDVAVRSDGELRTDGRVLIDLQLDVREPAPNCVLGLALTDGRPTNLVTLSMLSEGAACDLVPGQYRLQCEIASLPLLPGAYELYFSATSLDRALHYADATIVGAVVVRHAPQDRLRDVTWATTPGYGPVHVPFKMNVTPLG